MNPWGVDVSFCSLQSYTSRSRKTMHMAFMETLSYPTRIHDQCITWYARLLPILAGTH